MRTRTQEWKETTVGALLRLLEYVHGEVSERLQDWRCSRADRNLH